MLKTWRYLLGVTVVFASARAEAAAPRVAVIDPNVVRALDTGLLGAYQKTAPRPGETTVLIELDHDADAASLAMLARAGVKLAFVNGKPLAWDRFVPADVTKASLAALATLPTIARVSSPGPRGPLPLDQSAKLLRLADARGARPDLDLLTGTGTLIADVDSLVDPFEPAFFRGDAGYYDWIDVDGDGVFTPGKDAIDLDRNGAADSSEVALSIIARQVSYYGTDTGARASTNFDPGVDFLYLDTNGNGARDYGASKGFDDTVPAFGEPMFVPDDVDRNGKLDVGERVVRLGTSKFRNIYVNLAYPPYTANHVYSRGTDLSATKTDYSSGALEGFPDAFHATGVNTILVGDVPLVGRRWVGLAPDADVDVVWDVDQTQNGMPVKGFTWAMQDKPDVALFELAVWTGMPLDGTDALSTMIDTAVTKSQLTATCPTGDQGSARKHAHADVAASQQTSLAFDLPAKTKGGQGPLIYVDVSINIRGGAPETITIQGPNGESASFTDTQPGTFNTGDTYYATSQSTKRGTMFYDMILYADASQKEPPLPTGTWHVNVGAPSSATLGVDAYVADDKSSWAEGAAWDGSIATNAATIGVPSTADHCIAVNASPDHVATSAGNWYDLYFYSEYDVPPNYTESQGQIRAYSPRGPRIDGVMKPDVTAPDNPWVANVTIPTAKYPYGSYSVFGGTSGASPHVTGTAALLAQAGIHGDAARDAMRAGAIVDSDTGSVPNGDYGYGRLSAAGAFGVQANGVDPSVTLTVAPANPNIGDAITLVASAKSNDGNDAALKAKWDDGYDGTWDTTYAAIAPHPISVTTPGKYPFKVRVRNASGHIAEAVIWADVGDASSGGGCSCRTSPTTSELGFSGVLLGLSLVARRWMNRIGMKRRSRGLSKSSAPNV